MSVPNTPTDLQQTHNLNTFAPTMANSDTVTAAARVFSIPELLEAILTHVVDPYTKKANNVEARAKGIRVLFRIQMVNRTFRDVIAGSTALRRAMFLESTTARTKELELVPFNPLLYHLADIAGPRNGITWCYALNGLCDDQDARYTYCKYPTSSALKCIGRSDWYKGGVIYVSRTMHAQRSTRSPESWCGAVVSNGTFKINLGVGVFWKECWVDRPHRELCEDITLGELADIINFEVRKLEEEVAKEPGFLESLT